MQVIFLTIQDQNSNENLQSQVRPQVVKPEVALKNYWINNPYQCAKTSSRLTNTHISDKFRGMDSQF